MCQMKTRPTHLKWHFTPWTVLSPTHRARKFSAVLGTISSKRVNSTRPAGAPPMAMSKNTLERDIVSEVRAEVVKDRDNVSSLLEVINVRDGSRNAAVVKIVTVINTAQKRIGLLYGL